MNIVGLLIATGIVVLMMCIYRKSREGLLYLKEYEDKDFYQENKYVWPVINTSVTAEFAARRDMIQEQMKSEDEGKEEFPW